ncbi:flippase [Clostridium perfringens]|uniref:flippase n=1 Tax=Clostridium perfringens TaxID=1502 RepID=UPI0024BBF290|nr:flippase [Clostridium perfringens]MDK0750910.1 flippase [Clostridium perfringens]MDM0888538.1 flippase [Clostridium perfringens]MDM0900341.1 flippase [Clostridium perfringens]MDM0909138.1 flippase [Clostridium perfringens]MDM0914829.1 flippase [Clostridium perfringens]
MSVVKNFLYNTIYQVFIIVLPIITVPYISRVLGANGVGEYSYTSTYAQYFILLGTIGISLYGNRQIAYTKKNEEKMSKEFCNIYILQVITETISFLIYIIVFVLINNNNKLLYLVQSILILGKIFDISWFFIGYEDMKSVVLRNSIVKICGVILIFIFVKNESDLILYALIIGLSTLIGQLIMWVGIRGKISFYKPNYREVIGHIRPSLSLFISQLAIQVYILLDSTMLGLITDSTQVGLYANSQKTIKMVLALVTSLGVVMLPRMSALYSEGNMKDFKKMIYKAFGFVNFMTFPMVLGLIAVSDDFSIWFYGTQFNGIQILLKIGSFIILAISWSNILGIQIMLPMRKEKEFTISVVIGAITNVIFNLILISRLKAIGTTISSVVAEFSVTIVQLYFLRNLISIKEVLKTTYRPFIASLIMFIFINFIMCFIPFGIIYTFLEIIFGIIIYILIMITFKDKFLYYSIDIIKNKFVKSRRKNEEI